MGAVYRNGSIWAAHPVFLPAGGSPTRTAIQWWQLSPDGTILQRGMIDDPAGVNFYSWPSLSVNQFNDVLIGYSGFSTNQYASANYSFRYGDDPPNTLRGDTVFKPGEASYVSLGDGRNRWGDYSATVVDPLNDTDLWTIQEYAASPANTWGTWWGRVTPSPAPLPLLLMDEPTVTEGEFGTTNALFTVRLTHTNSLPVTVAFATADLSAQAGTDYTATNGMLTFAPGETNKSITVTVFGDLLEETNEAFTVTLNNPTNATLGIPLALGRIVDDDPLQISPADASVIEGDLGATNALFTVRLSKSYHLPVSVDFATTDGSALAGSDYVATNGTLNFAPSETARTITVLINGDELDETNETFVLNLTNPVNAGLAASQAYTTIVDDDSLVLAISDVSVREGDSGTSNALFTVMLSKPYHLLVAFEFSTANGSAVAGSDYAATNGTLTFAPGETTQIISVAVNGDLTDEANENFFLNLSNPVNVTLTDTQGKASILDDDPLVLANPDITVFEGYNGTSEARFTVSLSKPMSVPVSVDFATANGTALAGSDYVSTNGTITFLSGETNHLIVVAVIGDALDELNETFSINLTNAVNVALIDTQARATIVDDDDAMISISDAIVREGQAGQTGATFTVSLSTTSTRTVSVRASTANGSATASADYLPLSNVLLSFPSGTTNQTLVVQVLGDTLIESNEIFRVNLTSAGNGFIVDSQGVGTILDHDFRITAVELVGADVRLSFTTVAGWSYTVERTDDLSGTAVWTPVSGAEAVAGTGSVVNVLDPIVAGQSQRFYRVRLLP
jgi:hypothetical protein